MTKTCVDNNLVDKFIHDSFSALAILIYRYRWPFIAGPVLMTAFLGGGLWRLPELISDRKKIGNELEIPKKVLKTLLKSDETQKHIPILFRIIR